MATRKKGMRSIPGMLSQAKDVFPVTSFRTYLASDFDATADGVERTVELDLQFEDNEVLDVIALEVILGIEYASTIVTDDTNMAIGLFENPDEDDEVQLFPTVAATGVIDFTEAGTFPEFEDNNSLLWYMIQRMQAQVQTTSGGPTVFDMTKYYQFTFPQPYTVGRDLKWILRQVESVDDAAIAASMYATIWGRRRNAQDAEFKNIVYRQRF